MNLIEFANIKKKFKKEWVLRDISFNIRDGEIFGLVGTSGSGKSTILKLLIGMVKVDGGEIFFEGKDSLRRLNYLRKNTGFATQEDMLFDEMTIRENSHYFGSLYGVKKRDVDERFSELVSLLGLSGFEDTYVEYLSGGMVKRANLLVSLIHRPKLLILDEPTVGLDPIIRNILWNYIKRINRDGTTILVTSHLLDEIEENCSRIGILNKGEIVAVATPEQYREQYGNNKTFTDIFKEILGS